MGCDFIERDFADESAVAGGVLCTTHVEGGGGGGCFVVGGFLGLVQTGVGARVWGFGGGYWHNERLRCFPMMGLVRHVQLKVSVSDVCFFFFLALHRLELLMLVGDGGGIGCY